MNVMEAKAGTSHESKKLPLFRDHTSSVQIPKHSSLQVFLLKRMRHAVANLYHLIDKQVTLSKLPACKTSTTESYLGVLNRTSKQPLRISHKVLIQRPPKPHINAE
jgi:hypothetical protein